MQQWHSKRGKSPGVVRPRAKAFGARQHTLQQFKKVF